MDVARAIIKKFEGLRLKAYLCPAGVWTIGYGSTRIHGRDVQENDVCTAEEADMLFEKDFLIVSRAVRKVIKVELKDHEYQALISFAYNIGMGAFTKSTLLKLLNEGAPNSLVAAEFGRWKHAGGKVLAGLITRRNEERDLFLGPR